MARAVTLANLRTWARQLADVENDDNISDSELTSLVNRHLTEVYDALIAAAPPDYYASSTTVTSSAGVITYALEADFHSLLGVYVHESTDERRPLPVMGQLQRGRYKAPTGAWTVTVEYVPAAPSLASGSDTFDGVSGWEELIVNLVARDIMVKRESDPSVPMAAIGALQARINSRAKNRDKFSGKSVTDTDEVFSPGFPWGWTSNSRLACYLLRAGNIELYEGLTGLP